MFRKWRYLLLTDPSHGVVEAVAGVLPAQAALFAKGGPVQGVVDPTELVLELLHTEGRSEKEPLGYLCTPYITFS